MNKRVERKRAGVVDRTLLTSGNLALAPKWQATASALKKAGAHPTVIAAADRFAAAAKGHTVQPAPGRASGFVLLRLEIGQATDRDAITAVVQRAAGADSKVAAVGGKRVHVLLPTTASVSKIERELSKQNDEFGPGSEMRSVATDFETRMAAHGLRTGVVIEAAGSTKDGAPSPWLQKRFDALAHRSEGPSDQPLAELKTLIANVQQQKEKTMPLSLEQFDERVSRANKSMDRLETMVDSSAERQAVEEMRREVSALFAEQRRDIEMQQLRSVADTAAGGGRRRPPMPTSHASRTGQRRRPSILPSPRNSRRSLPVALPALRGNGLARPKVLRTSSDSRSSGRQSRIANALMTATARSDKLGRILPSVHRRPPDRRLQDLGVRRSDRGSVQTRSIGLAICGKSEVAIVCPQF